MLYLEQLEWHDRTKNDYYLAQIAAEIRQFREGFATRPKSISIEDCMLPFISTTGESTTSTSTNPDIPPSTIRGRQPIEPGPDAIKDPKWAEVNRRAKSHWAGMLGVESLEELGNGR